MSYEEEIRDPKHVPSADRVDISLLKYLWQSNSFLHRKEDNIPMFLRALPILENFTDNQLRILTNHLHCRNFNNGDVIFKQRTFGMGFYFIFNGKVDVVVEEVSDGPSPVITTLEKGDYFGELALLQEKSLRSATTVARGNCTLLGIFRPDLEEMINSYPIVATKLIQSISLIVADRLFSITGEVRRLKAEIKQLKSKNA